MEGIAVEAKGDQQSNDGEMQAEAFEVLKRGSFDKMRFREELLRGITNHGFQKPTLLQERAIPPVMDDCRDVIVEAVSGTGKTSMIAILACQSVDTNSTEEMALEMEMKIQALGNYMNVQAHACIGGRGVLVDDMCDNLKLGLGQQIVLGPRDRVLDLIKCGSLQIGALRLLVLDEFDEIFSNGFVDQICEFRKHLPSNLRVLLVGTTLPNQIVEITSAFMTDPLSILINELPLEKPAGTAAKPNGSFEELGLKDELVRRIYNYGFQKPSLLQQKAIPPITEDSDLICQGEPFTGKTSLISLATCQILDTSSTELQALILSPTRNRALQLERQILSICNYTNVKAHACFGGERVIEDMCDMQTLNGGVQILSGTPGRIFNLIERGSLRTGSIKLLVIDGFDEMHVLGFTDQICNVYRHLPSKLQVVLVTVTLPCNIRDITNKFMTDPVEILVKLADELTLEGIDHLFLSAQTEAKKFEHLCGWNFVLDSGPNVIFCNSKQKVEQLSEELREKKLTVSAMHEETSQEERDAIVEALKSANNIVVVSTDVLVPGLDVRQRMPIYNYELPTNRELYIRRVGYLGRYEHDRHNLKGLVLNIFTSRELQALNILRSQEGIVRDVHQHFGITVEGV